MFGKVAFHRGHAVVTAEVSADEGRRHPAGQLGGQLFEPVPATRDECEPAAPIGERAGDFPADAAGRTGHQGAAIGRHRGTVSGRGAAGAGSTPCMIGS